MHLLLITHYFPPDPAVGGLRAANIARAMAKAGHRVTVIATDPAKPELEEFANSKSITIHRIKPWRTPREVYAAFREAQARKRKGAVEQVMFDQASTNQTWWLKRWILALMWLPDDRQGFIPPAVYRALRVSGSYDVMYTSGPPWSTHVAGLIVHRRTRMPWVTDYRDPWMEYRKAAFLTSKATHAAERWLYTRSLAAAARVVCVSEGIRNGFTQVPQEKLLLVRNGIPVISSGDGSKPTPGVRHIVHAGTLYMNRDPRPFLAALGALLKAGRLPPEGVVVDFIGDGRMFGEVSLEKYAKDVGIAGCVRFHDWLPHKEAQAIIQSADVLLLLAQHQARMVPNKLYEYLGSRRPILAFCDEDGETARLLNAVTGHVIVPTDEVDDAIRGLEAALRLPAPAGDLGTLEALRTDRQMDVLVRELEQVAASAPGSPRAPR